MILNNKVSQRLEIIGFKGAVKKSTSRIQVLFFGRLLSVLLCWPKIKKERLKIEISPSLFMFWVNLLIAQCKLNDIGAWSSLFLCPFPAGISVGEKRKTENYIIEIRKGDAI